MSGRSAKVADYEAKAASWLADGNEAAERGNASRAEKCYDKAQYWHDKATTEREKIGKQPQAA